MINKIYPCVSGGTGENTNLMLCPAGTYSNKTDLAGDEDCTPCDGETFVYLI